MPQNYEEMIVTQDIMVKDDDDNKVELKNGTVLCFRHMYYEGTVDEVWYFSLESDYYGPRIIVPSNLAKEYIKNHVEYYQAQFSDINKEESYFGQVKNDYLFSIKNDKTKSRYIKVGEYMTKEGVKYNAAKILKPKGFNWESDVEKSYKYLEFFYIEPTQPIVENLHNLYKAQFLPPKPMKVCQLVVDFPQMLDVIDSFMHHQELSTELKAIYQKYNNKKLAAFKDYQEYPNIYITDVIRGIEKLKVQMQEAAIMRQIEMEVSVIRDKLIAERLGKVRNNILPDGFFDQPAF